MRAPVTVAHDAVHEVVVEQAELGDGGLQVQVDGVLRGHAPQVLRMAHPGQRRHDLAVARHAQVVPALQASPASHHDRCWCYLKPDQEGLRCTCLMGVFLLASVRLGRPNIGAALMCGSPRQSAKVYTAWFVDAHRARAD